MRVGDIVRPCPMIKATDSVGKAAAVMHQTGCPLLPVLQDGIVVGVIDEESLLSVSLNSHQGHQVKDLMRPMVEPVSLETPLSHAAWLMKTHQLPALPVVGNDGRLQGIVTRADVLSNLLRGPRPTRIGGMATPFGVYLTTGTLRAGVGDGALLATGLTMALCLLFARIALLAGLYLMDALLRPLLGPAYGTGLFVPYLTGYGVPPIAPWGGTWLDLLPWLEILLFFVFLRLLPLTGYHGAEHQVVHAIERGEDLTEEAVAAMPLEHPRCGTNLAALAILVSMVLMSPVSPAVMMGLVVLVFLFWRPIGMGLQRLFTVKRPKRHQLLSGIKAGEELLRRFQHRLNRPVPLIVQVWNMGFLQVFVGAWATLWGAHQILKALGLPRLLF